MLSAAFAMMYYLIALDAHTFGDLPEQDHSSPWSDGGDDGT